MAAKNKRSTRELKFKNSIRNNKKLKIKKELVQQLHHYLNNCHRLIQ